MKNSDDAIGRVLAGLRDVEAPDGMEQRIIEGLERRAAVQARSGWRFVPIWLAMPRRKGVATRLVCGVGVALAGVLVIMFASPAMRRVGQAHVDLKSGAASVEAVRPTRSVAAARDVEPSSREREVRVREMRNAAETRAVRGADSASDSNDAVALSEMQAASFPAPPMPLTEQERLLLRLARRVDPVEMAMLDPKVRALQDAEEKTEFQRFFGQTPRKALPAQLPPGQSTTEQASPEQPATEQAIPAQSTPEQVVPSQPSMEQPTQEQPTQEQSKPQDVAPDQSTTQQLTPRSIRTGENE